MKEFARRRLSVFVFVLFIIAITPTIFEEYSKNTLFAVDDITAVVLSVIGLIFIFAMWKKNSEQDLHRTNMVVMVLALVVLAATFYAFVVEDAESLGNDFPTLIIAIILLVNRFI